MTDPGTAWDWGAFTAAGVVFTIIGSIGTWLWNRGGNAAVLKQQVTDSKDALKVANDRAEKAQKAYDELLEKLHTHMLADAASFAKLEALTAEAARSGVASEARLTGAIDKLVGRIDSLSDNLNTFFRTFPTKAQAPQGQ